MRQVWIPLSVKLDTEETANEKATCLGRNESVKNVVVKGFRVHYEQLTWKDGYDKENLDD